MRWSPAEWGVFFTAAATFLGALAAAVAVVIGAIKGTAKQIKQSVEEHEENSQTRARELKRIVEKKEP